MKRNLTCIVLFLLSLQMKTQTTIMTYNIRYDNPNDKDNCWGYRKDELVQMIKHYQPDVIGIQEGLHNQVTFLDSALTPYDYAGVGRDDGKQRGEYAAVFYNSKKFKLITAKTWWLSETPDTISVGWDAALNRIVTFVKLLNKKNKDTLYVFNTHFDHVGKQAREKSAELILRLLEKMQPGKNKQIVMGDLNSEPMERPVEIFAGRMEYAYGKQGAITKGPEGTFNNFDIEKPVGKRIDYIFTKNCTVTEYLHIADRRKNGLWLSDHLPVLLKMK